MDGSVLWPRLGRYVPITPTPKQVAFLLLPHREAFYGGAAGGGKSVALLAAALQYADVPGYSALLVRRSYMELQQPNGLIDLSKRWLGATDAIWRGSDYTWRFPSGATLTFRFLDGRSELAFQGGEYQFIGIDEVTEIEELQYRFLFSRLRRPSGSPIPLRMRAASNPYGPGAEWVRARFVEEGPQRGRVFVRAVFEDNPHLDLPAYEDTLSELPPDVREQLRNGSWEVQTDGGLFRREWFEGRTVELPHVPTDLRLCRFWDLAATEAVGGRDPDHTAGVLLGVDGDGIFYVLDVVRTRSTPLGVEKLVARTAELDRQLVFQHDLRPVEIRMEQEPGSAGKAIVDVYARKVLQAFDFRGISSTGAKDWRAAPVSACAQRGHLLLLRGPWIGELLDELCSFPHARHDDQVDALAGAYAVLAEGTNAGRARVHRATIGEPLRSRGPRRPLSSLLAPRSGGSR
jgi:predicted phage terminase large subunit-like protein